MKTTKYDLMKRLAEKTNITKTKSLEVLSVLFEMIMDDLSKGNHVALPTIGTLRPVLHKSRNMGNIQGTNVFIIPPKLRMKLISSLLLKSNMETLRKNQMLENTELFK